MTPPPFDPVTTHRGARPSVRSAALFAGLTTAIAISIAGCDASPEGARGVHALPEAGLERLWIAGGADDADYAFDHVGGMIRGPDGSLWTWSQSEAVVRRWTAEGAPLDVVGAPSGGPGDGPGEFRSVILGMVGPAPGDSLWVMDPEAGRVTMLGWDGEVGSIRPSPMGGAYFEGSFDQRNWHPPIGLLADGSVHRRTAATQRYLDVSKVDRVVHLREPFDHAPAGAGAGAGGTYVNVHTSQFPPGEVRGQIRGHGPP